MPQPWEPKWLDDAQVWAVDFEIGGRRFRKRLGIRDRAERSLARDAARAFWRRCVAEAHAEPAKDRGPLFYRAAKAYVADGGEARFLPPLIRHFGERTLCRDITDREISEAAAAIYPGRAPSTVHRQCRVPILAVLRHAAGQRRRPSTDRARIRWLTPEEADALIDAADDQTRPKIAFLLGSGVRTGELFAARAADVNRASGQVWIAGEQVGAGKTALAARWVWLPPRAWQLIGEAPTDGALFRTPKGAPYRLRANGGGQMQAAFAKARDAAGLGDDVTPHVLRHTWATWFDAATGDFGRLMDLGGWAKPATAMRYRKLYPADLADRLISHGWDFTGASAGRLRTGQIRAVS